MPEPAPRLMFAQRLLLVYSMIVPALAVLGLPALYDRAAWLGRTGIQPAGPALVLCSSLAGIIYLVLSAYRTQFPASGALCLLLVFDTPVLVAAQAALTGNYDLGMLGWDGLIEICGAMLAVVAGLARAGPRREGLIRAGLLFLLGAVAPCLLLLLLLEGWLQAAVILPATALSAWGFARLTYLPAAGRDVAGDPGRGVVLGVVVVLGAIAVRVWAVVTV